MSIECDEVYGPLINGVFEVNNNNAFPAVDPATGKHLATIHYCMAQDVDSGVETAQAAFAEWKAQGQQERARLISALADAGRSGQ